MLLRHLLSALGFWMMKTGAHLQVGDKVVLFTKDRQGWQFFAGADANAVLRAMKGADPR